MLKTLVLLNIVWKMCFKAQVQKNNIHLKLIIFNIHYIYIFSALLNGN